MKTVFLLLQGIMLSVVAPLHLFSQCAGGAPAITLTYDTVVTGNGNSSRSFAIRKFDPALGTLLSAELKSVVGLQYSYILENQTSQDKVFKTRIVRTDDIYSTALDPASLNAVNQTAYVPSLILSHQTLNYGPANMNYTISNTVNDGRLINFMGAGTVDFDYETGTSASVQGPLPWQLSFTSVTDTTHFSVIYHFCPASLLSADLLFFSATPLKGKVMLNWRQAAYEENRQYTVQVSTDRQSFSNIAEIKENSSMTYNYAYLHHSSAKLYFRIQEKNISGAVKYSNIRLVEPEQGSAAVVRVFPTLYTGGSLQFTFPYKADWRITLYSAEGRKLTESRQKDVYAAQIVLPEAVSNGICTAEVVNTQTQEKQVTRIVVRR